MAKKEEGKNGQGESQPMEELVRPLGIVEVWQDLGDGKARVFVPIIHKPSKKWWEFPGGRTTVNIDRDKIDPEFEAIHEVFEETGLIIPQDAEKIKIPLTSLQFITEKHQVKDKKKNRTIRSMPMIFRFAVSELLPEITLNLYGAFEADDYRWIDMTPLYFSDSRDTARHIEEEMKNPFVTLFRDSADPSIRVWSSNESKSIEHFRLSEVTRKAIDVYSFWIMDNVPIPADFRGLRVE